MPRVHFSVLLLAPLLFCACQGGYRNYLPAPHEMAVNAALNREVKLVPEEDVRVQESMFVASDVQQALMKARGYIFIGQHSIRSEYAPSASSVRKAAGEIGASHVVYFVTNKETVREKRTKMQLNNLVSDLIAAKSANDLRRAGQRATKMREEIEDVTYYTYKITYWARDEGGQATVLTKSEQLLLADEMKKLQKEMRAVSRKISRMERRNPNIRSTTQYVHTTTVINQNDETVKVFQNYVQESLIQQINGLREAVTVYAERQKSMMGRGGSNPAVEKYDIYRRKH